MWCPRDDSHLTLAFDDHFVIKPTIEFVERCDISLNRLGEKGIPVEQGFEYCSGNNSHFLSITEIVDFNRASGIL